MDRISYERILVIVDITKPLPQLVKLFDHNERVFKQYIAYEWKPTYCAKYLQVGHNCLTKAAQQLNQEEGAKGQIIINLKSRANKSANP